MDTNEFEIIYNILPIEFDKKFRKYAAWNILFIKKGIRPGAFPFMFLSKYSPEDRDSILDEKFDLSLVQGVHFMWLKYGKSKKDMLACAKDISSFEEYNCENKEGDNHRAIGKFLGYTNSDIYYVDDYRRFYVTFTVLNFPEKAGKISKLDVLTWTLIDDSFDWKPLISIYEKIKEVVEEIPRWSIALWVGYGESKGDEPDVIFLNNL